MTDEEQQELCAKLRSSLLNDVMDRCHTGESKTKPRDILIMTDEERKKLCEDLLHSWLKANPMSLEWCREAADEIERLAEENDRFRRALNNAWRTIEEDANQLKESIRL